MKKMNTLAQSKGLKMAQLVRVAIAEYLRRNPQ
jgi:cold shock CspA family protein